MNRFPIFQNKFMFVISLLLSLFTFRTIYTVHTFSILLCTISIVKYNVIMPI